MSRRILWSQHVTGNVWHTFLALKAHLFLLLLLDSGSFCCIFLVGVRRWNNLVNHCRALLSVAQHLVHLPPWSKCLRAYIQRLAADTERKREGSRWNKAEFNFVAYVLLKGQYRFIAACIATRDQPAGSFNFVKQTVALDILTCCILCYCHHSKQCKAELPPGIRSVALFS